MNLFRCIYFVTVGKFENRNSPSDELMAADNYRKEDGHLNDKIHDDNTNIKLDTTKSNITKLNDNLNHDEEKRITDIHDDSSTEEVFDEDGNEEQSKQYIIINY